MKLYQHKFKAMGSPCELFLYYKTTQQLENCIHEIVAEVSRLENKYSRYKKDSLLSRINANAGSGVAVEID
ncbi:MAG: FAD:protein FMN transferase [Alteromonadaceae bacterium]|nr:FAD:protein FMN transferase [Alteromonadaceae bacterium]